MRRDRLMINKVVGIRQIREELRNVLKQERTLALEVLEDVADEVYAEAQALVPYYTWNLQSSIQVDVSHSPRYPGLLISASAINTRTGFDYAIMQEVREDYKHMPGRQAHY